MRTVATIAEVREALEEPRRRGSTIGLVPTMGAFHEGHLSLMRRARERCDVVVVSLFINPTQFNDAGDLATYPRDAAADESLAADLGVDLLFAPGVSEIYPTGFSTMVSVANGTDRLEGASRGRAHFDAVATVVTKLLNITGPDVAFFGQKDAQQAAMVRRLVTDLDIPVTIEVCPTVRAPDGLALSSRNARLSDEERKRATALHRALRRVRETVQRGGHDPAVAVAAGRAELARAGINPDYLELVGADTMAPVQRIDGRALAVVAATVGTTHLIDNELITTTIDNEVATPMWAPTTA
jgi:pantoate--beta-alanine ligase